MVEETKNTGGRPPLYSSPKELEEKANDYFLSNDIHTITGLALWLGFADRQSLYDYQEKEEFSCIIKKARTRVENAYENRLCTSASPTGAIFALKNMGWKDKQEVENTGNMTLNWQESKTYETKPQTDGGA